MLAGEEERSCWQVEEESENSDGCKGCVYYTVYIHEGKLQEGKHDQRGHAVTLTTHTHTHRRAEGYGVSAAKRWSPLTLWHCSWR